MEWNTAEGKKMLLEGWWLDGEAMGGWKGGGRLLGLNTVETRSL